MTDPLTILAAALPAGPIDGRVSVERWALHKPFVIARGTETEIDVIVVELTAVGATGRGESCPTPHYGETVDGVMTATEAMLERLRDGETWGTLHDRLPAGAARNAVDCALWDLAAKASGQPVHALLGLPPLEPVQTVYTIGLDAPASMAASAAEAFAAGYRRLKLKIGRADDRERLTAIRAAVPDANLIADVNEYWTLDQLRELLPVAADLGIAMLEQPLPAGKDDAVDSVPHPVPVGADESCHVAADLDRLVGRYELVNIKLDKSGGLTEALRILDGAHARGLDTMVGCMLGTSLAMAPSMVIAQRCSHVDLDAPLLIGADRADAMRYDSGRIDPPIAALWG